jgi:hypothetical protein
MSVEIRLLRDSELVLANNFYNEIYKTDRPFDNFLWEFVNGPAGRAIYVGAIDAAESATKVVGIQCAIPLRLMTTDGQMILTAKSEDTLVHPNYRGQKLFERMYDLLFRECQNAGIKYIWGFTPAVKAFERIGFQIPFRTTQALLVLKPIAAFAHLASLNPSNTTKDKIKILGLCFLSWVKGLLQFGKTTSLHYETVPYSEKTKAIQKFYEGKPWFFLQQDNSYNKWRFELNPFGNDYRNIRFTSGDQPKADAIINVRKDVSYIEQLLISSELSADHIAGIINVLTKQLRDSKSPLIRVLCFANSEEGKKQIQVLKKSGFIYLERGNYFVWKPLEEAETVRVEHLILSRLFTQGNL